MGILVDQKGIKKLTEGLTQKIWYLRKQYALSKNPYYQLSSLNRMIKSTLVNDYGTSNSLTFDRETIRKIALNTINYLTLILNITEKIAFGKCDDETISESINNKKMLTPQLLNYIMKCAYESELTDEEITSLFSMFMNYCNEAIKVGNEKEVLTIEGIYEPIIEKQTIQKLPKEIAEYLELMQQEKTTINIEMILSRVINIIAYDLDSQSLSVIKKIENYLVQLQKEECSFIIRELKNNLTEENIKKCCDMLIEYDIKEEEIEKIKANMLRRLNKNNEKKDSVVISNIQEKRKSRNYDYLTEEEVKA